MRNSNEDDGAENDYQNELCPGDGLFHEDRYPFIDEFSEFLSTVSIKALKYQLMTHPQRLLAKAFWEANNYGGSESKCKEHLKAIYGPKWYEITRIEDHMESEREYCEYVLILEYQRQWNERRKIATLQENSHSDDCRHGDRLVRPSGQN